MFSKRNIPKISQRFLLTTYSAIALSVISPLEVTASEEIAEPIDMVGETTENQQKSEIPENDNSNYINDDKEETNLKNNQGINKNLNIDSENSSKDSPNLTDEKSNVKTDENSKNKQKEIINEDTKIEHFDNDENLIDNKAGENSISSNEKEDVDVEPITTHSLNYLAIGHSSEEVRMLKNNLLTLGFGDPNSHHWTEPDIYFGAQTETAVKAFQEAYSLEVTGVYDTDTSKAIESTLSNSYSYGQSNQVIQELKSNLLFLGYGDVSLDSWTNPDGYFGAQTEAALKSFQRDHQLPVNGMLDPLTADTIEEKMNRPLSLGQSGVKVLELKQDLLILGFGDFTSHHWTNPDIYFGIQTETALKAFQEAYNLEVTGVYDTDTSKAIESTLSNSYSYGQSNQVIQKLKSDLLFLGYGDVSLDSWTNPDGYFGAQTETALKNFQKDHQLPVNGMLDPLTANKIESVMSKSISVGEESEVIRELKSDLLTLGFGDPSSTDWTNPDAYFGVQTETAVMSFQKAYNLEVTGVYDTYTAMEIDWILNNSYSYGQSSTVVQELKLNLLYMGYGDLSSDSWINPDGYFGAQTETALENFQRDHHLPINGMLDPLTANKIESELSKSITNGQESEIIRDLKKDLLGLGYGNPSSTDWTNPDGYFGAQTEQAVKAFQRDFNLTVDGIVDYELLFYVSQQAHKNSFTYYNITLNQAINIQMNSYPQTDQPYAYVSADYVDNNGIVTAGVLNVRSGAGTNNSSVGQLTQGTQVNIISEVNGWYQIDYNHRTWVNASREDTAYYLNPDNFTNNERQMFQFLNLGRPSSATAAELNEFLAGKGILDGMGQAFIDAGNIHGVNDVYLLSHALLETGNGTSTLATGVVVNGRTVYNMYGIGAVDSNPLGGGSQYAYDAGWFTPEASIIGGAQFIGNNYVKAGQNTLYKMRWNPDAMENNGYATHQYATDIGWASKQVNTMYNLYRDIGITSKFLDIPVYKN